jgi:hypothetical protein
MAELEKLQAIPKQGDTLEDVIDLWANGWFIHKRDNAEWYMNEYFTKEEAVRHCDNLDGWFPHLGDIAQLKLFLMAAGIDLNAKSNINKENNG